MWVDRKLVMCLIWQVIDCVNYSKTSHVLAVKFLITWVDEKLVMCLIWQVIDFVNYSKTSHVLAVASFWLRELIKNKSCVRYGELLIMWVDRKLVMCLIRRVIDCVRWSKTSHVLAVASFWLRELIENSSCVWYGELLIAWIIRKLVMYLLWQVFDYVSW
jgi:hypothetical protein